MTRVFYLLPTVLLSWCTYMISVIRFPKIIPYVLIRVFRKLYSISMDEVNGDLSSFPSLASFFIRHLKPEARPADEDPLSILSPVDGMIVDCGEITAETEFTVKGSRYTCAGILGCSEKAGLFQNGMFCVIHLRPFDYHRIHVPLKGKAELHSYIPGRLLPVHEKGRRFFPDVFIQNRRRITLFTSDAGPYALIKVGAFNVGRIPVEYSVPEKKGFAEIEGSPEFGKGDEVARFELGSTVVLLFGPGMADLDSCIPGETVTCRSRIGTCKKSS